MEIAVKRICVAVSYNGAVGGKSSHSQVAPSAEIY